MITYAFSLIALKEEEDKKQQEHTLARSIVQSFQAFIVPTNLPLSLRKRDFDSRFVSAFQLPKPTLIPKPRLCRKKEANVPLLILPAQLLQKIPQPKSPNLISL